MKKIRFYLASAVMVIAAIILGTAQANAVVPNDVKEVCGIMDKVGTQLVEASKGKQVDPLQTLMQLLPYTASATALDAESQAALGESAFKMMEGMILASGGAVPEEAKAQMKAEIAKEMQDESVLGPFVTDMLADLMGNGE